MADRFIQVKLTDEEFDALSKKAKKAGRTVHNVIRRAALLEEQPLGPEYGEAPPEKPKKEKMKVRQDVKPKGRVRFEPKPPEGTASGSE